MSKKNTIFTVVSLAIYFLCVTGVHAAEVTFAVVPNTMEGDTAITVEAHIDPKGTSLNAIEGIIGLLGSGVDQVSSVIVETGGSIFTLWPVNPVYSESEHVIRFTGGSPEGFLKEGLLFRMRIFSKAPGEVTMSWLSGLAYQNDGAGTPEGISSRSLVLSLTKNVPNPINPASADSVPPYFDTLLISQDQDVFDGKYFVSFHALDDASGIAKYEVVESGITTETEGGTYVLLDQTRKDRVVVIAYDNAGNSTSIKVPTRYEPLYGALMVLIVFVFILLVLFWKKVKTKQYSRL